MNPALRILQLQEAAKVLTGGEALTECCITYRDYWQGALRTVDGVLVLAAEESSLDGLLGAMERSVHARALLLQEQLTQVLQQVVRSQA